MTRTGDRTRNRQRLFWLGLFAVYLASQIARSPEIFLEGRFFAEEGAFYWAHALGSSPLDQLTFVAPIANYLLLNANLQTGLAAIVPLEIAPLATVWTSLVFMVLPAFVVMLADKSKFAFSTRFLVACTLLFGRPALSTEVLANSINSQVFLGLFACCLVVFGFSKIKIIPSFSLILLGLASLSGWYACVLFPAFALQAIITRSANFVWASAITLVGLVLQASIYLETRLGGRATVTRLSEFPGPGQLISDLQQSISHALLPVDLGILSLTAAIGVLALTVYSLVGRKMESNIVLPNGYKARARNFLIDPKMSVVVWSVICFIMEFCLVIAGRAGTYFAGRYAVVPSSLILVVAVIMLTYLLAGPSVMKAAGVIGIALLAFTSTYVYVRPDESEFLTSPKELSWQRQVSKVNSEGARTVYHWPLSEGVDPEWITDLINPKVRLAPFQEELLGK